MNRKGRQVVLWMAAIAAGAIGAIPVSVGVFRLSNMYFFWRYPHDGQDVLGGVYFGLLTFPVAWALIAIGVSYKMRLDFWKVNHQVAPQNDVD